MVNGYIYTECYVHGVSDLDQRGLKTRSSKDDVLSHQMSSPLPQNHHEPHFGGPFNAKPIIEIALRKSHVNRATKLKLYIHTLIGPTDIGKYLGVCQNFLARGLSVGTGPPNVIWDPLLSRKLLELES